MGERNLQPSIKQRELVTAWAGHGRNKGNGKVLEDKLLEIVIGYKQV